MEIVHEYLVQKVYILVDSVDWFPSIVNHNRKRMPRHVFKYNNIDKSTLPRMME